MKPLEGFLESFSRFQKNLWHLSDDTTKPGKVRMLFASSSLIIGNDKVRYGKGDLEQVRLIVEAFWEP